MKKDPLILLEFAKRKGFGHLSSISVTDWIEEGKYEVTYHLWSYSDKLLLNVKTKISRDDPVTLSAISLWGANAQIHERELHELFGVNFRGNLDPSPLFLEGWDKTPPFKKDFNWRDYVRKELLDKSNKREKGYWE